MNSVDPAAAIELYLTALPQSTRTSLGGYDGFRTNNGVYILFRPVDEPPPAALPDLITPESPQTAFWHVVFIAHDLRETLAPTHGTVMDHFALAVTDLDAWISKLVKEDVTFLRGPEPYRFGDMRAILVEGPSHEAIELVERGAATAAPR